MIHADCLRLLRVMATCVALSAGICYPQMTVVKPPESDRVLNNPGIGFTTFQRFNGDRLNDGTGWTEGLPIATFNQPARLAAHGYPNTSVAYLRLYWRFLEPEKGHFNWSLLDRALETAHQRGQTLMLRIAPHGTAANEDVPAWYRAETGETAKKDGAKGDWQATTEKWMIDPEKPAYAREFGSMVRELAERYDGDPRLELVDISILAAWGEGAGSALLTEGTRKALVESYTKNFHRTPLVSQLGDPATVADTLAGARNGGSAGDPAAPMVGWRADCLGDMGGFDPKRNHMTDIYPEAVENLHLGEQWKTAPVSLEACWVMQHWKDKGWDPKYITDQAIKWHASTFNNKSSAVPEAWWPLVNEWLRHMGYRFVLRRFAFSSRVGPTRRLEYESWWENRGNAPAYKQYAPALRIANAHHSWILPIDGDARRWLPGDVVEDGSAYLPDGISAGEYELSIALVDPVSRRPGIHLANEGEQQDGWLPLGRFTLQSDTPTGTR